MTDTAAADGWVRLDAPVSEGTVVIAPGHGAITTPSQDQVNILADGSHTRGLGAFMEYVLTPRNPGPPVHWHPHIDELFYIVSGEMGMRTRDAEGVFGPRSYVFVPRGMPHTFWNSTDDEVVFVSGWTPAGAEQAWLIAHHLMNEYGQIDPAIVPPEKLAELLRVGDSVPDDSIPMGPKA